MDSLLANYVCRTVSYMFISYFCLFILRIVKVYVRVLLEGYMIDHQQRLCRERRVLSPWLRRDATALLLHRHVLQIVAEIQRCANTVCVDLVRYCTIAYAAYVKLGS